MRGVPDAGAAPPPVRRHATAIRPPRGAPFYRDALRRYVHPMSTTTADGALATLRDRYLAAQLAGDRREALRLVMEDGVGQGVPVPALHLEVIQPAQVEIGRLWQENAITVADEHLATAISQLVVSHLYRHLPPAVPNGKRALVACAEGELHEMGARIAADFLEMAGFDVRFLGANVPADSVGAMVRTARPDLVVLSAATSFCFPGLRRTVAAVRAAGGPRLPILVGGSAFTGATACDAPEAVVYAGATAEALVRAAQEHAGVG